MNKRLFAAIDMPSSVEQTLLALNPHLPGVRWSTGNQMHLTLGFFDGVPDDVDLSLRERISGIKFRAFFLPIVGVGTFPAKGHVKIVWIGVGSGHPHLFQIYKRVQEAALAAGCEADLRSWHPHITLARCREIFNAPLQTFLKANAEFDAGMIRIDSFRLYSSEVTPAGSIHTPELTIPCSVGVSPPKPLKRR